MTEAAPLVLCIDDEAQLRADVVEELTLAGYRALGADSAEAAFALLEAERPDLVLCDISMPDADGFSVLSELRRRRPELHDVPFVFLTALSDREKVIAGKASGADDYLTKPVDYDLLLATVAARLAQVNRMRQGFVAEVDRLRLSMADAVVARERGEQQVSAAILERMAIGFLAVDAGGAIQTANPTADAILQEADALTRIGGRLAATNPRQAVRLRQALADCRGGGEAGSLVIDRDFRSALLVRVATADPAGNALVVTIIDPERKPALSPEIAAQLYGLTPTEAKLSVAIAEGRRPDEISQQFRIAQSTINFHLNNVFRKTGTSRQADLVALLVRTAVAPP